MDCLQDHFDDLEEECQKVVAEFTEDEGEDISLDKILMKACMPMINKFCKVRKSCAVSLEMHTTVKVRCPEKEDSVAVQLVNNSNVTTTTAATTNVYLKGSICVIQQLLLVNDCLRWHVQSKRPCVILGEAG